MFLARKLNFCMSAYVGVTLPHTQVHIPRHSLYTLPQILEIAVSCASLWTHCDEAVLPVFSEFKHAELYVLLPLWRQLLVA